MKAMAFSTFLRFLCTHMMILHMLIGTKSIKLQSCMDLFSFATNGTMGDPFQPNTIVSITFPLTPNPPSNPFQFNVIVVDPFAHA
jgi:hypothetical protein